MHFRDVPSSVPKAPWAIQAPPAEAQVPVAGGRVVGGTVAVSPSTSQAPGYGITVPGELTPDVLMKVGAVGLGLLAVYFAVKK